MSNDEKRMKAREIAEKRYGFRIHLIIYPIINAGLFVLWYLTGTLDFIWPVFPLAFWGVGLIAHYIWVYRSSGESWVDKETEKVLQDMS